MLKTIYSTDFVVRHIFLKNLKQYKQVKKPEIGDTQLFFLINMICALCAQYL